MNAKLILTLNVYTFDHCGHVAHGDASASPATPVRTVQCPCSGLSDGIYLGPGPSALAPLRTS